MVQQDLLALIRTNNPYGFEFPIVTVQDWVNSQKS